MGREAGADEPPDPVVLRRVLRDEHDAPLSRWRRDDRGAIVHREYFPVTIGLLDLLVGEDRPELDVASEGGHMSPGMPQNRRDLTQLGV